MRKHVPLAPFTTLRAGGAAELFQSCNSREEFVEAIKWAHARDLPVTVLGGGSNILPSDAGVPGLVIQNLTNEVEISGTTVLADTGCAFQELFLRTVQRGLKGFAYAVGIPGSLGGALVSNAGAYRSNVDRFITELRVVEDGVEKWVDPSHMKFAYRDSILRRSNPPKLAVVQVRFELERADSKLLYDEAREYQRQRIGKQPPQPSAGSFFKNVRDVDLAQRLPGLTAGMRENGVVPSGYLIEACGLKGLRHGGAMVAPKHANFIVNVNRATATEIRQLALMVTATVEAKFQVKLEEEVLYLGDWSHFTQC